MGRIIFRTFLAAGMSWVAFGQTPPQFEVAAVKPHNAKEPCPDANLLPGGRFIAACWPLSTMLREAYDVLPNQIVGGPSWINIDPWDITAKAEGVPGEIPASLFRSMLRRLIEERFHLVLKEETKPLPGLALVIARRGLRLTPNKGAPRQFDLEPGPTLVARKVTIAELAAWLKGFTGTGMVVVNETGVSGEYDFTLKWAARPLEDRQALDSGAPPIFTALQEQLGLRLKSTKVPTTFLVIERVERPNDN